ncbi:helix-turn-helix transcriptional regulator [Candidatus Roizmanbacteria bacterium]|nr:helix-turn-helix transcriptional regulator [Candidatus Roizmanbacteria bacterium]
MRGYEILLKIGKQIQKARRQKDISQEKLADLVHIHRNHMGRIERGETNVPIYTFYKIVKALKLKSSDFLPF